MCVKILAFFCKDFTNITSRDSNRANAPVVLLSEDIS